MLPTVVFMGSPEFALPSLRALAGWTQVSGVVTQPDKPAGRGRVLTAPPVKELALSLGLPVIQPGRLRDAGVFEQLQAWKPDVIVVAAFGQILRQNVLDLPSYGCINVHASLLPRWRGAAPIQASILHGDSVSGVTIMKMDSGIDTGPTLARREVRIVEEETAGSLSPKLAEVGADLLLETLPTYLDGTLQPVPQDERLATYAPMLTKEQGELKFSAPAVELARQVRAFHPWPGAYIYWQGQPLKILRAHACDEVSARPGDTLVMDRYPALGTAQGVLVLDELQPAGKRAMTGQVFLNGARGWDVHTPVDPS